MMRNKTGGSMLSLFYASLCSLFLLLGLFGLIWLRSSIVTTTYDLRNLEEKKMKSLRETKLLLAERSKLMSVARVALSRDDNHGGVKTVNSDYVIPNRVRVIHVRKHKMPEPFSASLELGNGDEPGRVK